MTPYDRKFVYPGSHAGYHPFEGRFTIPNYSRVSGGNPWKRTLLDGLTVEEISEIRMKRVAEFEFSGIFHLNYHPLKYYNRELYSSISPGKKWTISAPFFILNPYQLVVITSAGFVSGFNMFCPDVKIEYHAGVFREIHEGSNARCWFKYAFHPRDTHPDQVWVITVNAWDAGFPYAHVDVSRSRNVSWDPSPEHITNCVYSRQYVYHEGKGGNNISPASPNAYVTLKEKYAETVIYVKLWRQKPGSTQADQDLTYIVEVESVESGSD